jgi:hypothetical protein
MLRSALKMITCLVALTVSGSSALGAEEPKFITPEEIDKLPEGIKVVHEPKTALAAPGGKDELGMKYLWWYKTTVSALAGDVTIVEFGAFAWQDGSWVKAGTITGKPYKAEEFAEWYKCPQAVLKNGESFADPTNWSSAYELRASKSRWYYIGLTPDGKKVKGEAIIEQSPELAPMKPKDSK